MWRGQARRGRAGQAFELGEPSVLDGTPANSLAARYHEPQQDSQATKAKLLARNCLRILDRAWGQREPACERTSRSNCPARWRGLLKGGLDIPSSHAEYRSL